jgi:hypothetical protein
MAQDFTSYLMANRKMGPVAGQPQPGFGAFAADRMKQQPANTSGLTQAATVRPDAPVAGPLNPGSAPSAGPPASVSDRFLEFARQRQAARDAAMKPPPVATPPVSTPSAPGPIATAKPQALGPATMAPIKPTAPIAAPLVNQPVAPPVPLVNSSMVNPALLPQRRLIGR